MIQPAYPMTLGQIFADNARYMADEPAIVCGEVRRTHAELYRRGCRLAAALEALGVRRQDRIAVLSMNNVEFIETYVAGWTAGFVVATVNFRLALPEIIYILNDVAPKLLFVEAQYAGMIGSLRAAAPGIEHFVIFDGVVEGALNFEELIAGAPADFPASGAGEDDVASLIYTSGTTGKPKGCILGQRETAFNTQLLAQVQGTVAGERFLCVMPLFHIGAMAVGLSVLAKGGAVYVHRQFTPSAVIDSLERDRINMALFAPTMVQALLQEPALDQRDFSAVRTIAYSAAPMPSTVLRRAIGVFGPVFLQMFGSSEGCSSTYLPKTLHRPDGTDIEQRRLHSVGIPYPNVAIRTVDENGHDCAAGEPGELLLKSPVMFRGYWNNSAATLDSIRDGWYHTGDVGRFDDQGFLYLVDRKKDMIISGGENIYSREVEEALLQHPGVSEVAVVGRPDETWGETVCAIVVRAPGAQVTEAELIEHARSLIASYKKPRDVVFVTELPKVASGKIDKKILRAQYGAAAA